MKKTKQTMLTAAILSTALAMQGGLSYLSGTASAVTEMPVPADKGADLMAVVYGPPPARTTTVTETTGAPVTTTNITEISLPAYDYPKIEEIIAMYGPPWIPGDANLDDNLNIVDYVMLKDKLMNGEVSRPYWREDLNSNGEFDAEDLKVFEHYFLGLLSPYQTEEDTASVTEPVTSESAEETDFTLPETTPFVTEPEPIMGSLYGPPPALYNWD